MKEVVHVLASIPGVEAVGLGGSRGLGLAGENSDYDFVIFRQRGDAIDPRLIANALMRIADPDSMVDNAGFVRAKVQGRKIDVFQKDLASIESEIALAREGGFNWTIRPLFPHGDLSTCLVTHVVHLEICSEKNACLSRLMQSAKPFPLLLMHSLINTFLTQVSNTVFHAAKIRKPEDRQHLMAQCSAFFFFSNIVIFALNKTYPILEKGSNRVISSLAFVPENYEQRMNVIFRATLEDRFGFVIEELSLLKSELQELVKNSFATLKTVS